MGLFSENLARWNAIAHFQPLANRDALLLFKVSSARESMTSVLTVELFKEKCQAFERDLLEGSSHNWGWNG